MIKKVDKNDFDLVYEIMEKSFPSDEIRPCNEQKELFDETRYSVYAEYVSDGEIDGFIAAWEFDDFVFIEHFAVSPDKRNAGTGRKILNEFAGMTKKRICLETEPPESEIQKRRISFYERNGFYLNDYDYFQPPISAGKSIVPLMIMTYGSRVDEKEFQNIKNALYKEVYKYV